MWTPITRAQHSRAGLRYGSDLTDAGGPHGYDAGKKVWGRKRHALADTDGRLLVLQAGPASV